MNETELRQAQSHIRMKLNKIDLMLTKLCEKLEIKL